MATTTTGYTFDVEANTGPRAIITPSTQNSVLGAVVKMDGRASFDTADTPTGILNYTWSFARVPIGSQVEQEGFNLLDPDGAVVSFVPDIPGFYEIQLIVDDGSITSDPFIASSDVAILQAPNNRGLIPDASFIWNYLSDFWAKVEDREKFEVIWSAAIQILGSELIKTFQYDYNKSIRDIQELFQRRWVSYSPELVLAREEVTALLSDDQAGEEAATVAIDPDIGVVLENSPDFFNQITIPLSEGSFVDAGFGTPVAVDRLVTVAGRTFTLARSNNSTKAVNEGDNGSTALGGDVFGGSGFNSDLEGGTLKILSGDDVGDYIISSFLTETAIEVTDTSGGAVSFLATASGLDYAIVPSSANLSNFFANQRQVPTGLAGQFWRFSSTLISSEYDFEAQGVSVGDLLEVEVTRTDLKLYGTLRVQVVGVDRNKLSFVFNLNDLTDGVAAGGLSDATQESLAEALQVTGLSRDLITGSLTYSLEAESVRSRVTSNSFKRAYFETSIDPTTEIDLGAFSVLLRPTKVIRNTKIAVDDTVVSVPMLQEYIRQPDLAEEDGQLFIISRTGALFPIDNRPHVLSENLDYIIDDESLIQGVANTVQNVDEISIPRGDLIDRSISPGDTIELTVGITTQIYNIQRVLDAETLRVFPVPTATNSNVPFLINRRTPGKFIRFVQGCFTKDNPAPTRLYAELSYFSNNPNIEANFGVLVGVREEDLNARVVESPYRSVVQGLMFALTNGPVIENLRLSAQILLGLPFAINQGVITEVDPDFRIRPDGSPQFGRILIEARDDDGNPIGVTNVYSYPQGRQLADPDNPGEWIPATPNEAGIAINPATGEEYTVGDSVDQFAVLSKGVSVSDYLSDSTLTDTLVEQGSLAALLTQYHTFSLSINSDITTPSDANLTTEFITRAKPHYARIRAGIQSIVEDFVEVEDALIFGREFEWYDATSLSLPVPVKFDQGSGDDDFVTVEGEMFARYARGTDLQTTFGSAVVESAAGGFTTPGTGQSFDSPFLRTGDVLVIEEGNNEGTYPIASITSDTQITLGTTAWESLTDQRFSVYRPIKNPLFAQLAVTVTNGLSTVSTGTGLLSAGVAVGDTLTFYGGGIDGSIRYTIVEVDPATPEVTVTPPIQEASGSYTANVWRERLVPKYFLNEEADTPFEAAFSSGNNAVNFNTAASDEDQLYFLQPGDQIVFGALAFNVLDFDPEISTAYVHPAPGFTDAAAAVKLVRPHRPTTVISTDLSDRMPGEELLLDLLLPVGGQDLTTTAASQDVSTDSGEDFDALGVDPGDYLVVLEGADSTRNIGYGDGVFPIEQVVGTTTLRLTRPLTVTNGAPGIRYGIRRRKTT